MSGERTDAWSAVHARDDVERAVARLAAYGTSVAELAARDQYLTRLDLQGGMRVLDVGAGSGTLTLEIARRLDDAGTVVGLDPSAELLDVLREAAVARGLEPRISTAVGDARAMPFEDRSFDRAVCHWVLLHVDGPERVIAEMARVVRPGGIVLCVEVDWDTVVVHPGDRDVTRRILHASCDRHLDGWCGRRLVPWLRAAGLERVECLPIVNVDDGAHGDTWREYLRERVAMARAAGVVSDAEAQPWWEAIDAAYDRGQAFFSFTQFAVWGRVPAMSAT